MSEWFPSLSDYCFLVCWETVLPKLSPRLFEIPSVRRTHPACAWSSVTLQREAASFIIYHVELQKMGSLGSTFHIENLQFPRNWEPGSTWKWPLYAALRWGYPTVLHLHFIYSPSSPELHSKSVFPSFGKCPVVPLAHCRGSVNLILFNYGDPAG